jgi:crotonobetainyl-CoA:carnitine CoA-transferase CaiB-like acyl-CoA transferase
VENLICHIGDLTMYAAMNNQVPPRWGNRSPDFVPQGCYRCRGDDEWIALSIRSDDEWDSLVVALGSPPALAVAELLSTAGRRAAQDEIDATISLWTKDRSPQEATAILQGAGIPAGPVLDEAAALSDPQLNERGFFHLLTHPSAGMHLHPGANFQLTASPTVLWRAAPTLGQDNAYVYGDILGISDAEQAELEAMGLMGTDYI